MDRKVLEILLNVKSEAEDILDHLQKGEKGAARDVAAELLRACELELQIAEGKGGKRVC